MEQRGFIRGQHQQHIGWVDTQFSDSMCVNLSCAFLYRFCPQPQERSPFSRQQAEQYSHTCAAAGILFIGEDFMQPPTRQSAPQHRVDAIVAQQKQCGR